MVEGVRRFAERFGAFGSSFVVIGGTACSVILDSAFAGWSPNMKALGLQGLPLDVVARGLGATYSLQGIAP
jgi:hypothetical protein